MVPFLGGRYQNIFTVSWTRRRALLNWLAFRSHGVSRLRDAVYNFAAISACCRRLSLWGGAYGCISGRRVACFAVVRRCSPFLPACSRRPLLQAWAAEGLLGKISPWCVPGRRSVATFRRGVFPGSQPWQFFRLMRSRRGLGREKRRFAARFARHVSEMSWFWQDMRTMHPKSPANSRRGMHCAKILPPSAPFRCAGPSSHTQRANLAIPRCFV